MLTIKQKAQQRLADMWIWTGIGLGAAMTAIGEFVIKNDVAYYGGGGLLAASGLALAINHTRKPPKPPEDTPERPALRLEPPVDSTEGSA